MSSLPRTVLMVLESAFPVYGGGGAESQVLTLGRCLRARGVSVSVVVPMVAHGPQLAREQIDGLDVTRIRYPRVRMLGGAIMLAKLAWILFVRRREYVFIHGHIGNNMSAVSALMGRLLGKRVLIKMTGLTEIEGGILDTRADFKMRLKRRLIQLSTYAQATSTSIAKLLHVNGFAPSKIVVLPNGVDVDRFAHLGRNENLRHQLCGDAALVGLFVGRLNPVKGLDLLLTSWAQVFSARRDARLVLVGDGQERESLTRLAKELHIEQQVVFVGHSSDVAPYLAVADFGLLTSHAEGLSNSLLEYMACGLAVIGSRLSGTEDFVMPGQSGWLFEPGDGEGLTKALQALAVTSPASLREMGLNAKQHILTTASLPAVTDELLKLYDLPPAAGV
jgi:L-malate glycosyltransferase